MEGDLKYTHKKSTAFSVRKNFVFPFSSPSAFSSAAPFSSQKSLIFTFSGLTPDLFNLNRDLKKLERILWKVI